LYNLHVEQDHQAVSTERSFRRFGFACSPACGDVFLPWSAGCAIVAQVNREAIQVLLETPSANRRVVLDDGVRVFVKRRNDVPADFFPAEARGLAALSQPGALRVPTVFGVSANGIVVEDLGSGRPAAADWESAGGRLAKMHQVSASHFGFHADGYCGDSRQPNNRDGDGIHFFVEHRLLPQASRAHDAGHLDRNDLRLVEALCGRLRDLLPAAVPVLIHGDLWMGNLHACANGELALIDGGAVHYGWADCDLAMLTLFGEPPRAFFAAYEDAAHSDSDWRSRARLLNLYHLLNHLNLFGSGYLAGVRAVLARHA
jgi:protein-ribulosamine 3-kinase